jgi:hypothetical protein
MPIYTVRTRRWVEETVVVEADRRVQAECRADDVVNPHADDDVKIECAEETPGAKTNAYACAACHAGSRKTEWGPGWDTCPRCGARGTAPAVSS